MWWVACLHDNQMFYRLCINQSVTVGLSGLCGIRPDFATVDSELFSRPLRLLANFGEHKRGQSWTQPISHLSLTDQYRGLVAAGALLPFTGLEVTSSISVCDC